MESLNPMPGLLLLFGHHGVSLLLLIILYYIFELRNDQYTLFIMFLHLDAFKVTFLHVYVDMSISL